MFEMILALGGIIVFGMFLYFDVRHAHKERMFEISFASQFHQYNKAMMVVSTKLAERYKKVIIKAFKKEDPLRDDKKLCLANLEWMCDVIMDNESMPLDKASRWIGFIQGCLASRGLIDVDEERDVTREMARTMTSHLDGDFPMISFERTP